jgi:hypothetical protein
MDFSDEKTRQLMERICRERLDLFTTNLERHLITGGVDSGVMKRAMDKAMAETLKESAILAEKAARCEENRRIDSIGRLLVEYCFLRAPSSRMLWPEQSERDLQARREFLSNVVPRPLMRYFLISVRGAIDELDRFESPSLLLNDDGRECDRLRLQINERLENFKGPFGSGESQVDWDGVYENRDFQALTLKIIETMRHKLSDYGLETYLSHLQHYRTLDPESRGINAMHRPLSLDDARQLEHAMEFAESVLWQITQ